MESVLSLFGKDTVGVLMTGMGDDGAEAMVKIRKAGGRTIAESPETAVIFGMPRVAIEKNGAEFVLPNYEIASKIIELVGVRKE
jgi:two-component system chemotaxis response regulator CheB